MAHFHRYPLRLLTTLLLLVSAICVWLGVSIFGSYSLISEGQQRLIRQEQLAGVIMHLDETLTMSARMAAATGDLAWEERYLGFAPQLDAAILEAQELATSTSAAETNIANQKLVALETRAFELVRAGRPADAAGLLDSDEYSLQKKIYAAGMSRFIAEGQARTAATIAQEERWALLLLAAGFGLIACVLGAALWLVRLKLAGPLKALAMASDAMKNGDWNAELTISSRDEIGVLELAFNQMARTISRQTADLGRQVRAAEEARDAAERAGGQIAAQLATIQSQQGIIRQLSVPILPLSETAAVMPLIGCLDEARLGLACDQALRMIQQLSARFLVIDVTGVPMIDRQVAAGLLEIIQAARLLGSAVVLVGIRPEVAQTIVGLGCDMSAVITRSTLQGGIAYVFERTG